MNDEPRLLEIEEPTELTVLITFVLDRSGSMESVRDATISGFNEFKNDQARQPGRTLFSLTQFDTEFDVIYSLVEAAQVQDRDRSNYQPRGQTALYDAIAVTIRSVDTALKTMAVPPAKHLFVILTDGLENASRQTGRAELFDLIKAKEAQGWDFVYLGANQDAFAVGSSIGVSPGSTANYTSSPVGTRAVFAATMQSVNNYRQGGAGGQSVFSSPGSITPEEMEKKQEEESSTS